MSEDRTIVLRRLRADTNHVIANIVALRRGDPTFVGVVNWGALSCERAISARDDAGREWWEVCIVGLVEDGRSLPLIDDVKAGLSLRWGEVVVDW